jgi:hypothetical protein
MRCADASDDTGRKGRLIVYELTEEEAERWSQHVDKSAGDGGCWPYRRLDGNPVATGTVGTFRFRGRSYTAAHFALILDGRPIRRGQVTVRTAGCGDVNCVNPRHVRPGTLREADEGRRRSAGSNRGRPNGVAETKPRRPYVRHNRRVVPTGRFVRIDSAPWKGPSEE